MCLANFLLHTSQHQSWTLLSCIVLKFGAARPWASPSSVGSMSIDRYVCMCVCMIALFDTRVCCLSRLVLFSTPGDATVQRVGGWAGDRGAV